MFDPYGIKREGDRIYDEARQRQMKMITDQARQLDCYCYPRLNIIEPNWWSDGSLKYNVLSKYDECIQIPKGMYYVDCYGYTVERKENKTLPRPPHPHNEQSQYRIWANEMRSIAKKNAEKERAAAAAREKSEEAKAKQRLEILYAVQHPHELTESRKKIRNELQKLCEERDNRREPVIQVNPIQTKGKTKAYIAERNDAIKTYLIAFLIGCIPGLLVAVSFLEMTHAKDGPQNIVSIVLITSLTSLLLLAIFYALCNANGNSAALTTRGVNMANYEKAKSGDFFFNPPEDIRVGNGLFNPYFYPDGSCKVVRHGSSQTIIPRGLYFKDSDGKDVYGRNRKGPQPPNPIREPELFQLWLQEIKKIQ